MTKTVHTVPSFAISTFCFYILLVPFILGAFLLFLYTLLAISLRFFWHFCLVFVIFYEWYSHDLNRCLPNSFFFFSFSSLEEFFFLFGRGGGWGGSFSKRCVLICERGFWQYYGPQYLKRLFFTQISLVKSSSWHREKKYAYDKVNNFI